MDLQFKSPYGESTPLLGDTWKEYFIKLKAENINICFEYKDYTLKLVLEGMELFEIIKLIIILDCTTKGQRFKICEYCKRPYFVTRSNTSYCGEYTDGSNAEDNPNSCFNKAKKERKIVLDKLKKGVPKVVILNEFQNKVSPYVTMDLINDIYTKMIHKSKVSIKKIE